MCVYVVISLQLSQWSWSGQLASIQQTEAGVHGAGPDTDCEAKTEEGQGPLRHHHSPPEATTVSSSSCQSWKLITAKLLCCCISCNFEKCRCLVLYS